MAFIVKWRASIRIATTISLLAAVGFVAWIAYCSAYLSCCVYDWFLPGAATTYGPGYSEASFKRMRVGMRRIEVLQELGQPLRIIENSGGRIRKMFVYENGDEVVSFPDLPPDANAETTRVIYYYSQPANPGAHWCTRTIVFSPDGFVEEVSSDLYID